MRLPHFALYALVGIVATAPANAADERDEKVRESVVKVFATMRAPDPFHPWQKQTPRDGSGTGVVIEGNRILTNAHVVSYASQVFIQPHGSGQKIPAVVEVFAPGIDLAVLKLDDESFFETRKPLTRSSVLPEVKDSVVVYGYPTGGDSMSVTKGIVSRIEFTGYGDMTSGLRIQVDAAINPGNSGGPALVNDEMIGLTFSRLGTADNIGYIIPTEEVEMFLKDVSDHKYDGKPTIFDQLQTLENDALKLKLALPKGTEGMVVTDPEPDRGEDYPLKRWDVITRIGDKSVDSVGMVQIRPNLRLAFQYFVQSVAKDGKLPLTVVRDGKEVTLEVPVRARRDTLIKGLSGKYPSYFVYGPLVFSPVTSEFASIFDRQPAAYTALAMIGSPLALRRGDTPKFPGEELVVVASPLFPHKVAKGYSSPITKIVKSINGTPIKNLRHLVETLRDCKDKYVVIDFDDRASETLVFDRKEITAATEEILTDNGVRKPMSDDLTKYWDQD